MEPTTVNSVDIQISINLTSLENVYTIWTIHRASTGISIDLPHHAEPYLYTVASASICLKL